MSTQDERDESVDGIFKGDRGKTGDTGQPGATGETGRRGEAGATGAEGLAGLIGEKGIIGERGRTGDHGQPGDRGRMGDQGETGATGRAGVISPQLRRVLILGYVLLIAGLVLSATISQSAIRGVQKNAHIRDVDRYQSCLDGIAIINQLNAGNARLAEIEKRTEYNTPVNAAASAERVKAYESFLVTLTAEPCGPKP